MRRWTSVLVAVVASTWLLAACGDGEDTPPGGTDIVAGDTVRPAGDAAVDTAEDPGTTTTEDCVRSAVKTNPTGKRHGERCTTNEECMYGMCYTSSSVTGLGFGICTKNCSCGDDTTMCNVDDPPEGDPKFGFHYNCYRPAVHTSDAVDTMTGYCVPECTGTNALTDWCADHDAAYTACETPYGVRKVCTTGVMD